MQRISAGQQRQDLLLAATVCVGALISATLSAVAGIYGDAQAPFWQAVVYAFVLAAPLALRRRWPATVAVIVAVAYFGAATLRVPEVYAGNIAMFIAFYTVGAWARNRVRARWTRLAIVVGMFAWLLTTLFIDATTSPAEDGPSRAGAFSPYAASMLLMTLINALYFAGAYWFGERTWAASRERSLLEDRTAELERERERTATQAVALERLRIARELHDVVAHHVSLMGVQAGVARTLLRTDSDNAAVTLSQVEDSARTALNELRQLLETLRTGEENVAASTVSLSGLEALAEEATAAGLPTTFTVVGPSHPLPETAQLNLFRIAQEALTNARRHGGVAADLRLRYASAAVEIEVVNTGRRVTAAEPGMGHLGMRERAAASGGSVEIGPRPGGGFLVRARVPREPADD